MYESKIYPSFTIARLIVRDIRGELSRSEQQALQQWKSESSANEKLYQELRDPRAQEEVIEKLKRFDEEAGLRRVHKRIREKNSFREPVRRRLWLRVAAAMLLLATVSYLSRDYLLNWIDPVAIQHVATLTGQREQITLPDGSRVWLSPASTLEYPEAFRGNIRKITLVGEAFFEVASDKKHPFIIHSGAIATKVTGTSFTVQAYPAQENASVTVLTGNVIVTAQGNDDESQKQVSLAAEQRAVFQKASQSLIKTAAPDATALLDRREGIFTYRGTPVADVIADMRLEYPGEIIIEGSLENCTFYGTKQPGDDVPGFLKKVSVIINADYQKDGNKITLTSGGCPPAALQGP